MGAFPDTNRLDIATKRYLAVDPSQADFIRLLRAEGERAENLRRIREQFASPIFFVRGNHEDFDWLYQLPVDESSLTAPAQSRPRTSCLPNEASTTTTPAHAVMLMVNHIVSGQKRTPRSTPTSAAAWAPEIIGA